MSKTQMTGTELVQTLEQAVTLGVLQKNLTGQNYMFTGTLSTKREDLQRLTRVCGGRLVNRPREIGRNGALVVGDTGRFGKTAKIREAEQWGVQVITETEFVKRIQG